MPGDRYLRDAKAKTCGLTAQQGRAAQFQDIAVTEEAGKAKVLGQVRVFGDSVTGRAILWSVMNVSPWINVAMRAVPGPFSPQQNKICQLQNEDASGLHLLGSVPF
jgi:hypothetical protein